ncbi:MAG: hypothetical protein HY343_00115 [Lentisphaerae bacterium]|nr:hypothetical protein [Lentisphaerota bacterium]
MFDHGIQKGIHMLVVEATVVDATHLELSKPIGTRRGQTVFVSVSESGERDMERQSWLSASSGKLISAYGDSEPVYTTAMVKEHNSDYNA